MARLSRGLAIAAALLVSACTQDVERIRSTTSAGSDSATTGTVAAEAYEGRTYDPAKDPLVNAPEMLMPMPADPTAMAQDQTIIRHSPGNPSTLNPLFWSTGYDSYGQTPLYDGLITFDADFNWMLNTDMVESYEVSDDQRVWTFRLRDGLKWHDGHPLGASDFVFSWHAIMDEQVPAFTFKEDAARFETVEAPDPRTVRIVIKEALPINKWLVSYPVVPEHIFGNSAERANDPTMKQNPYYTKYARTTVIGNGPYRLVEWIPNDRLTYERWEDYVGEKPYWKRIIIKIQPDQNTSLQLFKQGQLDELEVTPQQFAFETNDESFARVGRKALNSTWGYTHISWNMDGSNPFFTDLRVRRAMAHAMNIRYVLREIGYNLNTQAQGIFHPDSWMANPDIQLIPYDLAAAARLLDEAGWIRDQQDGWRYKTVNGRRVRFSFELLMGQGSQTGPKIGAIYQQDLAKIGVDLQTRVMEAAAMFERTDKHDFQAYMGRWGTGVYPDTSENLWKTEMYKTGRNYGAYSNPRVDELFGLATREFDEAKRRQYYQEIQKLIYDDQPSVFLWNVAGTFVVNNKVRGVNFSPRGIHGHYPGYYKWWIPAGTSLH